MVRNNEPGDFPAPWVWSCIGGGRVIWRFRADVPDWATRRPSETAAALVATGARFESGPVFVLDGAPPRASDAVRLGLADLGKVSGLIQDWSDRLAVGWPVAGVIEDGLVV